MSRLPEHSRCRRLRAGDPSALADLFREFEAPLARELRRRFGLQDCDIEDVEFIALEDLWEHRGSFDPEKGTVETLYWTIALNVARNLLKSKNGRDRLARVVDPARLTHVPDRPRSGDSSGRSALSKDLRVLLAETLSIMKDLPEVQRRVLLADAASPHGKLESGILAEELGLRASTVRTHRQRGLATIRRRFAERERERERERRDQCSDAQ